LSRNPYISIVDDDDSVRSALRRLLKSFGMDSIVFSSGEELLRYPNLGALRCLISDVQMQSMSGLDLQRALCAQGRNIPIIFITAFPDETIESIALAAGACCFLLKPFSAAVMMDCVNKALGLKN
jgi:FixJ family two-component response regulator